MFFFFWFLEIFLSYTDAIVDLSRLTILQYIKAIAQSGAKVIVSGANVSDLAMHFIERYQVRLTHAVPSAWNACRRRC